MSNVIEFRSPQSRCVEHCSAESEIRLPTSLKEAALRGNARDVLGLLVDQLECAMQHARAIEPKMRDLKTKQNFRDRIEIVERLLDVARLKILQL
jgi:hypothetical protein